MVTRFTHWLKLLAARVLHKEMENLRNALMQLNVDLLQAQRQRDHAMGQYSDIRRITRSVGRWAAEIAERSDGGETQSRMLFIRDMMDHGPAGPYAGSSGVHPADRWNIQSFDDYRRGRK